MLGYLACAALMPLAAAELKVPSLTGPGRTSATFKGRCGSTCAKDLEAPDAASTSPASNIANNFNVLSASVIVFLHSFFRCYPRELKPHFPDKGSGLARVKAFHDVMRGRDITK